MKIKLLLLISFWWVSISSALGNSSNTNEEKATRLTYSLCGDNCREMIGDHTRNYDVRMYIRIPAAIAKIYEGAQISEISVGLTGYTGKVAYVFVTTNPDKEEYDVKQSLPEELLGNEDDYVAEDLFGWHTISIDNPYTITGDKDVYIGCCHEMPDKGNPWLPCLGSSSVSATEDGSFYDFREHGTSAYTRYAVMRNVAIRAHLAGDNLPQEYLVLTGLETAPYRKPNEQFEVHGTVMNYGAKNVEAFKVACTLDGEEDTELFDQTVSIGTCEEDYFSFHTSTEREGKRTLTLEALDSEGKPYESVAFTTQTCDFANISGGYERKILLETITNIDYAGNEATYELIKEAIEACGDKKKNIVQVNLHIGDQFANSDTREIQWFYESKDANFVPAASLNRYNVPGSLTVNSDGTTKEASGPLFLIDENFSQHLQSRLNEISYISMNLNCEYSEEDKEIYITIDGKPFVEGVAPASSYMLGVMLVENGVLAPMEGYEGDYNHDYVPRVYLCSRSVYGDETPINNKGYATEFYYSLQGKTWNPEKMQVVAYLTDYDVPGVSVQNKFPIVQAAVCPVKPVLTSISSCHKETNVKVTSVDGVLCIDGEFSNAFLYDLVGNRIKLIDSPRTNVSDLVQGIYCIKIITSEGNVTAKVFIGNK